MLANVWDIVSLETQFIMKWTFLLSVLALSGCAGSYERMREAVDQAPEWYAASRKEFAGEGYRSLKTAPGLVQFEEEGRTLQLSREEINAAKRMFEEDPRAQGPVKTPEQILAWVASKRAILEAGGLPPTEAESALFLSDEQLQRLQGVHVGSR